MKSRAGRKKEIEPLTEYVGKHSELIKVINNINRDLDNLSDAWRKDTHGGRIAITCKTINDRMKSLKKLADSKIACLRDEQRKALANSKKV